MGLAQKAQSSETSPKPDKRLTLPGEREKSIRNDTPATFEYRTNEEADAGKDWWEKHSIGRKAYEEHGAKIDAMAEKHGVDPDLMQAIMYMENSRGHKFGFNKLFDQLGISSSQEPMNIKPSLWGELIGKDDLSDASDNIEAATILVKRISERLDDPTPEAVGSIWNYIGRETSNDLGAVVDRVYRDKPWLRPFKLIDPEARRKARHGNRR